MHRPDQPHLRLQRALACLPTQRIGRMLISNLRTRPSARSAGQQTGVDPQARPPTPPSPQEQEAAQKRAAQQAAKEAPKGGAVKDRPRGRPVALRSVPSPGTPALAQPLARLPVPCVVDASRRNLRKRLGSKLRNRQRWRSSSRRHRQQPSTRGS